MKKEHTIQHLKYLIDKQFHLVPKSIGVELVNLGFMNYTKLTAKNYNYWWYEVQDIKLINPKNYTFIWTDLVFTTKAQLIFQFIDYHNPEENMEKLMNALLNIESARFDGVDINTGIREFDRQINFYYGNRTKPIKQLQLFSA